MRSSTVGCIPRVLYRWSLSSGVSVQGLSVRGGSLSGGVCPGGFLSGRPLPPVDRLTDACESIALAQTSFADGNNVMLFVYECTFASSCGIFLSMRHFFQCDHSILQCPTFNIHQ